MNRAASLSCRISRHRVIVFCQNQQLPGPRVISWHCQPVKNTPPPNYPPYRVISWHCQPVKNTPPPDRGQPKLPSLQGHLLALSACQKHTTTRPRPTQTTLPTGSSPGTVSLSKTHHHQAAANPNYPPYRVISWHCQPVKNTPPPGRGQPKLPSLQGHLLALSACQKHTTTRPRPTQTTLPTGSSPGTVSLSKTHHHQAAANPNYPPYRVISWHCQPVKNTPPPGRGQHKLPSLQGHLLALSACQKHTTTRPRPTQTTLPTGSSPGTVSLSKTHHHQAAANINYPPYRVISWHCQPVKNTPPPGRGQHKLPSLQGHLLTLSACQKHTTTRPRPTQTTLPTGSSPGTVSLSKTHHHQAAANINYPPYRVISWHCQPVKNTPPPGRGQPKLPSLQGHLLALSACQKHTTTRPRPTQTTLPTGSSPGTVSLSKTHHHQAAANPNYPPYRVISWHCQPVKNTPPPGRGQPKLPSLQGHLLALSACQKHTTTRPRPTQTTLPTGSSPGTVSLSKTHHHQAAANPNYPPYRVISWHCQPVKNTPPPGRGQPKLPSLQGHLLALSACQKHTTTRPRPTQTTLPTGSSPGTVSLSKTHHHQAAANPNYPPYRVISWHCQPVKNTPPPGRGQPKLPSLQGHLLALSACQKHTTTRPRPTQTTLPTGSSPGTVSLSKTHHHQAAANPNYPPYRVISWHCQPVKNTPPPGRGQPKLPSLQGHLLALSACQKHTTTRPRPTQTTLPTGSSPGTVSLSKSHHHQAAANPNYPPYRVISWHCQPVKNTPPPGRGQPKLPSLQGHLLALSACQKHTTTRPRPTQTTLPTGSSPGTVSLSKTHHHQAAANPNYPPYRFISWHCQPVKNTPPPGCGQPKLPSLQGHLLALSACQKHTTTRPRPTQTTLPTGSSPGTVSLSKTHHHQAAANPNYPPYRVISWHCQPVKNTPPPGCGQPKLPSLQGHLLALSACQKHTTTRPRPTQTTLPTGSSPGTVSLSKTHHHQAAANPNYPPYRVISWHCQPVKNTPPPGRGQPKLPSLQGHLLALSACQKHTTTRPQPT